MGIDTEASTGNVDRQVLVSDQLDFRGRLSKENFAGPVAEYLPNGPEANHFGYSDAELDGVYFSIKSNNNRAFPLT